LLEGFRCKVFFVTKTPRQEKQQEEKGTRFIRVPDVPLSRLGQVKIAVFMALTKGLVSRGDIVVCLSGFTASGTLDTLVVTEVVGAIFVVGDANRVLSMSRPLILNPFHGHPEEKRNIMDRAFEETIKELSTIDGAFVVRGDGVVESCGVLLKTAGQEAFELPRGLGARHHAAAGITAVTKATAVTVSESTGNVMVFRGGKAILEVEKIRLGGSPGRVTDLRQ
jgi:hypothetical protein